MTKLPTVVKKVPLYKDLTIIELNQGSKGKYFYEKNGDIIFPMNGKFAIAISGLYEGEDMPLLDEVRTAQLLKLLGKVGWNKCYFRNSLNN